MVANSIENGTAWTAGGLRGGAGRRLLAVMGVVALLGVGCGGDDGGGDEESTVTTGTTGTTEAADQAGEEEAAETEGDGEAVTEEAAIEIVSVGEGFQPGSVTVPAGSEVTWVNSDSIAHTTTAEDETWDSGSLEPGAEFSFTAEEPGTYPYICSIHPSMQGELVVE